MPCKPNSIHHILSPGGFHDVKEQTRRDAAMITSLCHASLAQYLILLDWACISSSTDNCCVRRTMFPSSGMPTTQEVTSLVSQATELLEQKLCQLIFPHLQQLLLGFLSVSFIHHSHLPFAEQNHNSFFFFFFFFFTAPGSTEFSL